MSSWGQKFGYHIFWNLIGPPIRSPYNLVKNEKVRPFGIVPRLQVTKFMVSNSRRISGHREATNNKLVNNIPGGKICTPRSNAKSGMQPFWYTAWDTSYSDIIHLNRLMCQTDYRPDPPSSRPSPSRRPWFGDDRKTDRRPVRRNNFCHRADPWGTPGLAANRAGVSFACFIVFWGCGVLREWDGRSWLLREPFWVSCPVDGAPINI